MSRISRLSPFVLSLSIVLPAMLLGSTTAEAGIRCEVDENGMRQCYFVDENGDPQPDVPPPPVDLNVTRDDRRVYNYGWQCWDDGYGGEQCGGGSHQRKPDAFKADFSDSAWSFETGASQTSSLGLTGLRAEGNVYAGPDAFNYSAFSFSEISILFDVEAKTQYSLYGFMETWDALGELWISDDGDRIWEYDAEPANPAFDTVLDLLPGNEYKLYMKLRSTDFMSSYQGVDYRIDFYQTPEPGSGALVGLGLAALAHWRRRGPQRRGT